MTGGTVRVEGLRELRSAARKLGAGKDLGGALREVFSTVASVVETRARSLASATHMGSAAIGSITGKGTTTAATLLAFKGKTGDYGPGFAFGSSGAYPQFMPRQTGGGPLYQAVAQESGRIQVEILEAIDFALAETFPD